MKSSTRVLATLFIGLTPLPVTSAYAQFVDVAAEIGVRDGGVERGLAWGDYDGDGDPDLFVAIMVGPDQLFRNDGDRGFTNVAAEAGLADSANSGAAAWLDYDADGHLDLYVARIGLDALFHNQGDGTFLDVAPEAGTALDGLSWSVIVADDDLDGDTDIYVVRFDDSSRLLRNIGGGRFRDATYAAAISEPRNGTSAAWGDYDNDGDPDLFLANKLASSRLLRNEGNGHYEDVTHVARIVVPTGGVGATWGDFDNDGDLDMFLTRNLLSNLLLRNDGTAGFADATERAGMGDEGAGRGPTWGDYDNDGDLDLYVSISTGPDQLYRNDGDGRFGNVTEGSGLGDPGIGTTSVWADYDGDGDLDLTLSKSAEPLRLYENRLANGNHWLEVRLEPATPTDAGSGAAPGAHGARVTVYAGPLRVTRENFTGSGGYQVQAPRVVHFGLGDTSRVDSLRVVWPRGDVQTVLQVEVDQQRVVTQGERH